MTSVVDHAILLSMAAVSHTLADFLSRATWADLPRPVIVDTQRSILDWLGSAMAGSIEPPARMAQQVVSGLGACDEATVFSGRRSSAAGAALANGVASHILELDDIHKGSTVHAAAPVIPAALAVAERENADGRAFILAVALGYEAALRIGEAVNPSHYKFWHPTGTAATFGAAAAAGSLLGLDERAMLDALGSAGTQAAGLWEFNADGAMSKHLHPGKAAFNGVLSADLARAGFTGATSILEGARGFFRAMSSGSDETRVTDRLGERWKISENCYKIWSCCGHTHSAVDVAVALRRERGWKDNAALDDLSAVHIETYGPGFEIVKQMNPGTPFQAKFSIAYCVAAGLLYGGATLDAFSEDHFVNGALDDDDVAGLLSRTTVSVADDLTAKYPAAWPTRVTFTFADGSTVTRASDFPVGNPENPVSTEQLEEKFASLVAPRFGDDVARRALEVVRSLESIGDVNDAFHDLLVRPGHHEASLLMERDPSLRPG
jgi:2-methylcitrate dehydratase PrpD